MSPQRGQTNDIIAGGRLYKLTQFILALRGLIGVVLGVDAALSIYSLSSVFFNGNGKLDYSFFVYLVILLLCSVSLKALWGVRRSKEPQLAPSTTVAVTMVALAVNTVWYIYAAVAAYLIYYPHIRSQLWVAIYVSLSIGILNLVCPLPAIHLLIQSRRK